MTALVDVQAVQSRGHGERGVARYVLGLAAALERSFPDRVERYLVRPDLPVPPVLDAAVPPLRRGRVGEPVGDAAVYHLASAFESEAPLERLWPPVARRLRLVVTLYDLIPELFPESYLRDPAVRLWYRTRLELVRRADRVLAISRASAADAVSLLRLPPERVVVVGAAPDPRFVPPASREAALAVARAGVPALEEGFLLYTGGIDFRKNVDRLFEAYARMVEPLRRRHQLVLVCRIAAGDRVRLEERLRGLGIADRVLLTGFVADELLAALYGATRLFVFPSLYEGYGLPVAEAVACGAPVIASDTSSLVELVREPAARFDPRDPNAICATLMRTLSDAELANRLRDEAAYARDSWDDVAARTASVYDELSAAPARRRRARSRPRVAYISPLPPQRSGVADYSYRLLEQLDAFCAVDAFVDRMLGSHEAPPGVRAADIAHFTIFEGLRGGYDAVFVCLGNSEHHIAAVNLLRSRGGVVLAHDVRLSGMYAFASKRRRELEPRSLEQIVLAMYGGAVPPEVAASGVIDPRDARARDVLLAREAIAASDAFLVHSDYAADLARAEAAPADRSKIGVVPFAMPDPDDVPSARSAAVPTVGSFGVVAPVKQTAKLVDAFALIAGRTEAELAIVGPPAGPRDYDLLRRQVHELGLDERVRLVGHLDDEAFGRAVAETTVAVQLRSMSMGETSASVGDCLAAGVPTVVSDVGSSRELPDEVVVKVAAEIGARELGEILLALLRDEPRRTALGIAAQALARERSFAAVARFLYESYVVQDRARAA